MNKLKTFDVADRWQIELSEIDVIRFVQLGLLDKIELRPGRGPVIVGSKWMETARDTIANNWREVNRRRNTVGVRPLKTESHKTPLLRA